MLEIKLEELVHVRTHTHYDSHQIDGNIWWCVTSESSRVHCETMKAEKGKSRLMVFMEICLSLLLLLSCFSHVRLCATP